jgi:PAS domain-containing protein
MTEKDNKRNAPPGGGSWPDPRLRALQVEEIYKLAPVGAAMSYFGALLTLGVLISIGDIGRAAAWFLWATAVTFFRWFSIVQYRRRAPGSDPDSWGRLVIAGNLLAGIQWGLLGTLLFPDEGGYVQLFVFMVIICFVAGSVTAYAPLKWAHEALSIPATVPTAIYLFFVQTGVHWLPGVMALFFCYAIVYFARRLNRHLEEGFKLQIERDDLLALTGVLNEKLERENQELAHRVAVRSVSVEDARERADRLESLFERSPLPHVECDAAGNVITCNAAAERVFGLRADELAGKPLGSVLAVPQSELRALRGEPSNEILEAQAHGPAGIRTPCTATITSLPATAPDRRATFVVVLTGIPVAVA